MQGGVAKFTSGLEKEKSWKFVLTGQSPRIFYLCWSFLEKGGKYPEALFYKENDYFKIRPSLHLH